MHASLRLPISFGVPSRAAPTGGAAACMPKYRSTCPGYCVMAWAEQCHMWWDDRGSGSLVEDFLVRLCVLGGLASMNGSCVCTHVRASTADGSPVQGIFPSLSPCFLTWSLLAGMRDAASDFSFCCCWCYICMGVWESRKNVYSWEALIVSWVRKIETWVWIRSVICLAFYWGRCGERKFMCLRFTHSCMVGTCVG